MAIARSTRKLVERALTRREAVGRAALAEALQAQSARAAEVARQVEAIAREQALAATVADPRLLNPAWRTLAGTRLEAARAATAAAEAACDTRREALADTRRTLRGFDALMTQQDAEAARAAARRDPLATLMLLPRPPA